MRRKETVLSVPALLAWALILAGAANLSAGEEPAGSVSPEVTLQGPVLVGPISIGPETKVESASPATGREEVAEPRLAAVATRPQSAHAEDAQVQQDQTADAGQAEDASESDASEGERETQTPPAAKPEPQPKPELSPEMAALRDRVRRTLAFYYRQPMNTQTNVPSDVIHFCLAFGCDTGIRDGSSRNRSVNGIGALCWNYPCAGYRILQASQGRFMARIGYGLQQHPSQLLAVLAQSKVSSDYEIRVGEAHGTVADLVEYEKLDCRRGQDLSLKLIGLAHYVPPEETWNNDLGDQWSVGGMVEEELARSPDRSSCAAVHRLMGLSFALDKRRRCGQPLEGQYRQAHEFIKKYQEHALRLQNPDGSWHPGFFAYVGTSRDTMGVLRSTGHLLEWLAFSLPEERVQDPQVVKSVAYVTALLGSQGSRVNVASMSPRDIAALMHALHALSIYDRRVFKPADPEQPTPESEQMAEAAGASPALAEHRRVERLPTIGRIDH